MGRHVEYQKLNPAFAEPLFYEIKAYLENQGFKYLNYEGENVFQKGEGWFVAPTFVKIGICGDTLQLETWMKYALLPTIFVGEIGLTGFVGWLAKGPMKNVVATVPMIVSKYNCIQPQYGSCAPTQPQLQYQAAPQYTPYMQPPQQQNVQYPQYPQNPQYPQSR